MAQQIHITLDNDENGEAPWTASLFIDGQPTEVGIGSTMSEAVEDALDDHRRLLKRLGRAAEAQEV